MSTTNPNNRFIAIGLMLFALLFGAGNLIFPAAMGQSAGVNVWWALLGFLITGVGLPLLGIMAMGYSGCDDLEAAASRVHPYYGIFYAVVSYMAIGPCFAVPRTGSVAYEIAVAPFLGDSPNPMAMPLFLLLFFGLTLWLSASPQKLVDRIGKILTPALVLTILLLIIKSIISPLGELQAANDNYATPMVATIQGMLDGYNTLDAIASLVFATLVVSFVRDTGLTNPKAIAIQVYKSGLLAVGLLAFIYIFIAKIGAESVTAIGLKETGAPVLAETSMRLFGNFGAILLAIIVLLACLSTAIGLITCCASYFLRLVGIFSYTSWVCVFTGVSFLVALFGLKTIILSTIPVLMFIYPLAVALIALLFLDKLFDSRQCVYVCTIALTFVMALISGLETANVQMPGISLWLHENVPLYTSGLGWISFSVVGFLIGLCFKILTPNKTST